MPASIPTPRSCNSTPAKVSAPLRKGVCRCAEGLRDAAAAHTCYRRSACATRVDLVPAGKFADAIAPLREALRLKPGLAESRCAAGHVAVGAWAIRRSTAGAWRAPSRRPPPILCFSAWLDSICNASTRDLDAIETPSTSRSVCRASIRMIPKCCITRAGCSRTSPICRR